MKTKAQLEIIGLVFIVLIVALAMLIYLSYSVGKQEDPLLKEYQDNELGASFASTFAKITVEGCSGLEMNKLLEDCASNERIYCSGGRSSCDVVNETMIELLANTLDTWEDSYGVVIRWTMMGDEEDLNDWTLSEWKLSPKDPNNINYLYNDEKNEDKIKWGYTRYNCTEETTGKRAPGLALIPIGRTGDSVSVEVALCAN